MDDLGTAFLWYLYCSGCIGTVVILTTTFFIARWIWRVIEESEEDTKKWDHG